MNFIQFLHCIGCHPPILFSQTTHSHIKNITPATNSIGVSSTIIPATIVAIHSLTLVSSQVSTPPHIYSS
nr:MAG TPA: cytochrome c-552 [Caudoviricetes sp.]